ncbi:MAG: hypothetical protein AAF580_03310 [Pseudomonadota bacterium]
MMVLRLLGALGWRNTLVASVGAVLAVLPSFQTGRWVERSTFSAKLEAARMADRVAHQENLHDRYRTAAKARLDARSADRAVRDAGGLSDDGWRRD